MNTFPTIPAALLLFSQVSLASPAEVTYVVAAAKSSVRVQVGKTGLFSFAGHTHTVEAPVSGSVSADSASLALSRVELTFPSARLRVSPEGEPEGDAPKVEEMMRGERVLDVMRFPEIHFRSMKVAGKELVSGTYELTIEGDLSLHGVTRRMTVPVKVRVEAGSLTATGEMSLRHDQFGMKPVTAVGGTIKVANELRITFRIVADRQ